MDKISECKILSYGDELLGEYRKSREKNYRKNNGEKSLINIIFTILTG
jgi:hypothetical protein